MLSASCHCGAIRIQVACAPAYLIRCNCSICRRNGALWARYESGAVSLAAGEGDLVAYVWGQASIRTLHCRHCGCATHWEPLNTEEAGVIGINMRNFDPALIRDIRIRRFDGADTWTYLDE